MTVLENIELCDNGYTEVQESTVAQKIRLRTPSYGTISAQYQQFLSSQNEPKITVEDSAVNSEEAVSQNDIEIVDVVAINPRIAEMIVLLEIKGRIKSDGFKALKIKPTMHMNMLKNAEYQAKQIETITVADSNEQTVLDEPSTELIEMDGEESTKVSKNGATAAKIEKFTSDIDDKKEIAVSPLIVEETNAREVSRVLPLIAPERNVEDAHQQNEELTTASEPVVEQNEAKSTDVNTILPNNVTDLAAIKEYLEKTARLQREAEQAKEAEATARINAEKAEQEAANRRDEFRKTAERIVAHQEELIAQKEKSREQTTLYDTKREEYKSESAEYQKAIDDMLALIGDSKDSKEESKGKIM